MKLSEYNMSYMSVKKSLLLGTLLFTLPDISEAQVANTCGDTRQELSSCSPTARNFESVLIALPGWNGSCSTTFGTGGENILSIIGDRKFFDVDCFDYDSHDHTIKQSSQRFKEHLEALKEHGYKEFSVLTHSTGGVIALDLFLNEAFESGTEILRPKDTSSFIFQYGRNGLKLKALHAWAVPLNGIRKNISYVANPLVWTNRSSAVLPDLNSNSHYLENLRTKVSNYFGALPASSDETKAAYSFQFSILQGQQDDWVVRGIDPNSEWVPKVDEFKIVDTNTSHSQNVAVSGELAGTIFAPKFPALVTSNEALIELELLPRFDLAFSEDNIASTDLNTRQRKIIDGIVNYTIAPKFFQTARSSISKLISRMFTERYPRTPELDTYAVEKIGGLVAQKILQQHPENSVEIADLLIDEIEFSYQQSRNNSNTEFGGGSKLAVRALAKKLNSAFESVSKLVEQDRSLENYLKTSNRNLTQFQNRYIQILNRISAETDPNTRSIVFNGYQIAADIAEEKAIIDSKLIRNVNMLAIENRFVFDEAIKDKLGDIFVSLSNRSQQLNESSLEGLTSKVPWLNKRDAPVWATFLSQNQVERIGKTVDLKNFENSQNFTFSQQVVELAGPQSNQPDTSIMEAEFAIKTLKQLPTNRADPALLELLDAANASPYPKIKRAFSEQLTAIGKEYLLTK